MAVYRETPKCPYCGKVIAKGIYKKQNPFNPVYGDSFLRWEYKKHNCKEGRKAKKEMQQRIKDEGVDFDNLFKRGEA